MIRIWNYKMGISIQAPTFVGPGLVGGGFGGRVGSGCAVGRRLAGVW